MGTREELRSAIDRCLIGGDFEAIEPWLHGDVMWGSCHTSEHVLAEIEAHRGSGVTVELGAVVAMGDRFVVDLVLNMNGENSGCSMAVFDEHDLIVEIHGPTSAEHARAVERSGPFPESDGDGGQVVFERVAPVFAVSDLPAAIVLYTQLGFDVESYDGGAAYAFGRRGDVELHLAQVPKINPKKNMTAIYLYVSDARALFAEWKAAQVPGRLHAPSDTDYGLVEGAYIDPDGNLLRFGSPF